MIVNKIYCMDCLEGLKQLENDSVDCLVTDPPYGYSFMGKDWDKAVPSVEVWKECFRVMKAGSFGFVMSSPRQDVLSQMIMRLGMAGFDTGFTSIYWAYASGFPKAGNISKMVDKRGGVSISWFGKWLKKWRIKNNISQKEIAKLFPSKTGGLTGCVANWELSLNIPTPTQFTKICRHFDLPFESIEEAEREVIGKQDYSCPKDVYQENKTRHRKILDITKPATSQAKVLDGSYAGFQPKPAVEIILVVMKPLSEKTFVDQALKNGKGVTWLDDCRIPINPEIDDMLRQVDRKKRKTETWEKGSGFKNEKNSLTGVRLDGRFPANLLVSDDVLNDGSVSFSRYFDLDNWAVNKGVKDTFPFLIVPKASKSEKNKCIESLEEQQTNDGRNKLPDNAFQRGQTFRKNFHPTVKPLKLMSYLVTLGSRKGDLILDPFMGSGTTALACKHSKRNYIGFEISKEYCKIANKRLSQQTLK